jgi:hypothetical protein
LVPQRERAAGKSGLIGGFRRAGHDRHGSQRLEPHRSDQWSAVLFFFGISLIVYLVPALRASRVDPVEALHTE